MILLISSLTALCNSLDRSDPTPAPPADPLAVAMTSLEALDWLLISDECLPLPAAELDTAKGETS